MILSPRKLYKDLITDKIVGISYGSADTDFVNEVLLSVDEAKRLKLEDSDIIDYLDLPVVEVYVGKMNMLFPAGNEIGFNKDDIDDGIILDIKNQVIFGHVFDRLSGIRMNDQTAMQRVLTGYDGKGETSR